MHKCSILNTYNKIPGNFTRISFSSNFYLE